VKLPSFSKKIVVVASAFLAPSVLVAGAVAFGPLILLPIVGVVFAALVYCAGNDFGWWNE
jgi:hypothetical protein